MCASVRAWGCALGLVWLVVLVGFSELARAEDPNRQRGRELFVKVWEAKQSEPGGDGLGPMFNERSCTACHMLGGIGGAGPLQHNVELLTAVRPESTQDIAAWSKRLPGFHPGLTNTPTTVLHRFSTDAGYNAFRENIVGLVPKRNSSGPIAELRSRQGDRYIISQRSTTSLFGAGFIDNIDVEDIRNAIGQQMREDPAVVGRFVGRFGWRGQMANLQNFVLGACAIELGLNVPGIRQSPNPLRADASILNDMGPQQCVDLVEFVANLPAPRRLGTTDFNQRERIRAGEDTFRSIGCATCHRQALGGYEEIYTDLLVHDMGARLEDPASPAGTVSTQYYGHSPNLTSPLAVERQREWKTPPLWGLRDSGPYLHDGRAATVEEAIMYHGGQAASAAVRYSALPPGQQSQLLLFLSTLAGPDPTLLARYAVSEQ
jgi:CxxC motif-containing protein (DUF1111 family)